MPEPFFGQRLRVRRGLVELVKDEHVERNGLHPDRGLHAAEVEVGVPDPLEPSSIGVGEGSKEKGIVCDEGAYPRLRELQHVRLGREVIAHV